MAEGEFRTCPVTGLKVHLPTQRLILANLVMAIISIIIGGIAAAIVGLSRALLYQPSPSMYYMWLTAHGLNMLIFWILWFEIPLLYFVSAILLNTSLYRTSMGWLAFILMLVGWIMLQGTVFTGNASVMFTAYPPMAAHPLFYVGYLLFVLGAGIGVILYFLTIYKAKIEGTYKGHLPLVTWGAGIAAIIALTVVVHGVIVLTYTLLWRIGLLPSINVMLYRWYFWGAGHDAQYINVTAMVAVWYALLAVGTVFAAARFVNERFARIAFAVYVLFTIPAIGHHILVDPGFSIIFKQASGSVGSHFLAVASMLHALALLGALEATLRASGHTGLFGWLARIPWKNPGIAGMILSMILFGIGGVIAMPQTTLQPNLNFHNTMWIPSHLHGTVVGGTTLAFMALSYYLVPLLTCRKLFSVGVARAQIYMSFIGLLILIFSMAVLGWLGTPRRTLLTQDIMLPQWIGPSYLLGIGAIIFIIAGALFVLNILLTLLAGKRTTTPEELVGGLVTAFKIDEKATPHKKGSLIIVTVFLVVILLAVYFVSFARLAAMPPFW